MKNFKKSQAQKIIREIEAIYKSPIKKLKWTDIYNTEQELVDDLKKIVIPENQKEAMSVYGLYRGCEYIHPFAKATQNGKTLTEKQMTQAKRNALGIKEAASISKCWY